MTGLRGDAVHLPVRGRRITVRSRRKKIELKVGIKPFGTNCPATLQVPHEARSRRCRLLYEMRLSEPAHPKQEESIIQYFGFYVWGHRSHLLIRSKGGLLKLTRSMAG